MAQLERPQRNVDTSKTPTIHTMEQLLREGESSKSSKLSPTLSSSSSGSSPSSPFFHRLRHHDSEEDHGQNQKKSVLTKVKEKAKKLRHSLSKKKHEDGNVTSPTEGAGLEGYGVEEDAEFHGAPMYESEKAPEGYKENASPVTPEKHVKPRVEQAREKSLSRSLSKRTTQAATATSPTATTATSTTLSSPTKTMAKTIADKVTPASAEGLDAAHSITSKIQGITVSKPTEHHNASSSTAATKTPNTSLSFSTPLTPPAKLPSQTTSNPNPPQISSAPVTPSPSSVPPSGKNTSPTSQIWDKGVSVKEYLMNKLEPGEDEKALSQVISEAMSPRRTPGDAGVMEKVREAVTSLLRNEEPTKYADATHTTRMSSQTPASNTNVTRASSQIPVSSNAQEVVQEENHGRILQAN